MNHAKLAERIVGKVDSGGLPSEPAQRVLNRLGRRLACDACGRSILSGEVEHELLMPNGETLRMHVVCHGRWLADLLWRGLWGNRLAGLP